MTSTHIRFNNEEYEPSDSEDEYTSQEKDLLKRVRNKEDSHSESEDAVYGVDNDSSSDDDNSDIALSDVEGQGEDNELPDVRAWGKDKRRFYSTDYVDPDYGGYQGKDAALADLEEEEARNLQKQLMQQLDDDDFSLDLVNKSAPIEDTQQTEEIVKTDISKLSKRQKINLLVKESPEFFGLVDDFKSKMLIVQDFLEPIIHLSKEGKVPDGEALQFVRTHYEIILNYCTNINMYLLLKASRVNVQNHPVIKRLYQYRQLLAQLDPIFEEVIQPQIEIIIEKNKNNENGEKPSEKKTLKLLKNSLNKSKRSMSDDDKIKPSKKKLKQSNKEDEPQANVTKDKKKVKFDIEEPAQEDTVEDKEEQNTEEVTEEDSRRAITYQIAKNKGLTPRRSKLQRNPRVKHRDKYRKAKIRRKGAIREVRTEMSRYGGEISGIKATVTKSIKIKS